MNISQDVLARYQDAGISILDPEQFNISGEVDMIASSPDEKVVFRSLDDPSSTLTFENAVTWMATEYGGSSISYCEVTAENEGRTELLYGVDDNGRTIGSIRNISDFISSRFASGFVSQDEYDRNADKLETAIPEDEDAIYAEDLKVFDEYPIPTAEEARKEYEVEKADVPPNMEELTAFDFSGFDTGTYSGAFGCGYIPYEFRIGFEGDENSQLLTKEDIELIRENYDPDFGYVLGIDTTVYDDSPQGNIEVIDMSYDTVKPFIMGIQDYAEDKIEYVRAYKESGEGFEADGKEFHVVNLVTIDIKVEGVDMPFRHTEVIDDAGISRGHLELRGYSGILDLNTPGKYFKELDKFSDLERPEKDALMKSVETQIPDFFKDFTDRMDQKIDERRPLQEARMEKFTQDKEALRNVFNRVELYREIQAAKIAKAEYRLDNTLSRIKKVYEPMTGKPVDSAEYKELNRKFEGMKNTLIRDYHAYMKISHELEPETLNNIVRSVRANYDKAMDRYNDQKQTIDAFFEQVYVDDTGYRHRDSYRESVIDNKHIDNPVTHFEHLCMTISLKHDGFPIDSHGAEIVSQYDEAMEQIDNGIKEVVDKFNESASELEKVHIDSETGQIYTSTGFKVEPTLTPRMTVDDRMHLPVDKIDLEDKFNGNMIKEDMKTVPFDIQPMKIGPSDIYERMSIREYASSKAPGETLSRGEYDKNFISKGIYARAPEKAVDNVGRRSADAKKNAIVDRFGIKERTDIKNICETVDKYIDREAPTKREVYRDIRIEAQKQQDTEKNEERQQDTEKNAESSTGYESSDRESVYESREERYERRQSMPYGKTDNSRDVQISAEKMKEFRDEAKREANGDTVKEERIYQKKCGELAERLAEIKKDIIHYEKQMAKFDDIPFKWKGQHTYYQAAKLEYDSAIKEYQNIGGRVGKGEFVEKGVSKMEALAGRLDVLNTNLLNTLGFEKLAGRGGASTFKDIYRDSSDRVDSYAKFNNVTKAFNLGFGYTFGEITRMAVDGIDKAYHFFMDREKTDRDDQKVDKDNNSDSADKAENRDTADQGDPVENDISDDTANDIDPQDDADMENSDIAVPDDTSSDPADTDRMNEEPDQNDSIDTNPDDRPESEDEDIDSSNVISDEEKIETPESQTDIEERIENPEDTGVEDPNNDLTSDADRGDRQSDKIDAGEIAAELSIDTDVPEETDDSIETEDTSQDNNIESSSEDTQNDDSRDEEKDRELTDTDDEDQVDDKEHADTENDSAEKPDTDDQFSNEPDISNPSGSGIDEQPDISDEADDDIEIDENGPQNGNIQTDPSHKEDEETSVDAIASQNSNDKDSSVKEELTQAIENVLTEKDDMEVLLDKLSDIIAEDSLSIDDISDALFDAITGVPSGDEAIPAGTENVLYEISNALDGPPLDNLNTLLSNFDEKGLDTNLVYDLENSVANSFESSDVFEVDMAPEYGDYIFESGGVMDAVTGSDAVLSTDYQNLESQLQGHMDLIDYGVDQDIPMVDHAAPDAIEVNGIDSTPHDYDMNDLNYDTAFSIDDSHMMQNDYDNHLPDMDMQNPLDMIPDTAIPDTPDIAAPSDTDTPDDYDDYLGMDVSGSFFD